MKTVVALISLLASLVLVGCSPGQSSSGSSSGGFEVTGYAAPLSDDEFEDLSPEQQYQVLKKDEDFWSELRLLYQNFSGRPTPLYHAQRLSQEWGCEVYLKRDAEMAEEPEFSRPGGFSTLSPDRMQLTHPASLTCWGSGMNSRITSVSSMRS